MLLLVAMLLLGVGGGWAEEPGVPGFSDTCDYTRGYVSCGDQCILWGDECHCGPEEDTFRPLNNEKHCCLPPGGSSCIKRPGRPGYGEDAVCSEGRTLPMSSPCNNTNTALQCHNDYLTSEHLGLLSHYRCPQACVRMLDMCRGVR